MSNPVKGYRAKHYYVAESVSGTTPDSPEWTRLRVTGGNTVAAMDASISAELGDGRDITDIVDGSITPTFEAAIEFSAGSYTDLLEASIGGTFSSNADDTSVTVTVDADAKTFTRSAGDFTSKAAIGSIVQFPDLTGNNAKPLRVVSVTATVITVDDSQKGRGLEDESSATTDVKYSNSVETGLSRRSFSILSHYPDANNGSGEYAITTGVEVTGFSITGAANSRLTGTVSLSGKVFTPKADLPSGSTYATEVTTKPYHYVQGSIQVDGAVKKFTGFTFTQDNGMSAIFELGCGQSPSFYDNDQATNTVSLEGYFRNSDEIEDYLAGTEARVSIFASDAANNAFGIELPLVHRTSGQNDISAQNSATQTVEGRARGTKAGDSSIQFHEIVQ